jgi:acetyl-CoA carboxylase biotin carboxyl carrier protein
MDKELLNHLIHLLESSRLMEIEHSKGGERIRLVKSISSNVEVSEYIPPPGTDVLRKSVIAPSKKNLTHAISASLVGLFFRSPAPDEPTFVNVGDVVKEGQSLGIVEAMKMLNLIEADRDGKIVSIGPEDGDSVEPGTVLFELEPLGETNV